MRLGLQHNLMKMNNQIILLFSLLFILGCTPETITKYQCENGEVVDSIELCSEQKCPVCPKCPEIVCKTEKEPYVESKPYTYKFKYGLISESTSGTFIDTLNYGTKQTTRIKNLDEERIKITVENHYRTLNKEGTEKVSAYMNSGETRDFMTTFDTDMGEDVEVTTKIIAPTETRYKSLIKYKDVEKCSCE